MWYKGCLKKIRFELAIWWRLSDGGGAGAAPTLAYILLTYKPSHCLYS